MKRFTKFAKSTLALILTFAMVAGSAVSAFAATGKTSTGYLFDNLGDSKYNYAKTLAASAFSNYKNNVNESLQFAIPGLSNGSTGGVNVTPGNSGTLVTSYTHQGLEYSEEYGLYVLTGYDSAGSNPTCLFIVDKNGNYKCTLPVYKNAACTTAYTGHGGGVAIVGDYLYLVSGLTILYIPMSQITSAVATGNDCVNVYYTKSFTLTKSVTGVTTGSAFTNQFSSCSFCSSYGGLLWVGEFCYDGAKDYPDRSEGMMFGLDMSTGTPVCKKRMTCPEKTQGIAFFKDSTGQVYLACSTSYGRTNASKLWLYKPTQSEWGLDNGDGLGTWGTAVEDTSAKFVHKNGNIKNFDMPNMSEDMTTRTVNGKTYLMANYESGSWYYHFKDSSSVSSYVMDRVSAISFGAVVGATEYTGTTASVTTYAPTYENRKKAGLTMKYTDASGKELDGVELGSDGKVSTPFYIHFTNNSTGTVTVTDFQTTEHLDAGTLTTIAPGETVVRAAKEETTHGNDGNFQSRVRVKYTIDNLLGTDGTPIPNYAYSNISCKKPTAAATATAYNKNKTTAKEGSVFNSTTYTYTWPVKNDYVLSAKSNRAISVTDSTIDTKAGTATATATNISVNLKPDDDLKEAGLTVKVVPQDSNKMEIYSIKNTLTCTSNADGNTNVTGGQAYFEVAGNDSAYMYKGSSSATTTLKGKIFRDNGEDATAGAVTSFSKTTDFQKNYNNGSDILGYFANWHAAQTGSTYGVTFSLLGKAPTTPGSYKLVSEYKVGNYADWAAKTQSDKAKTKNSTNVQYANLKATYFLEVVDKTEANTLAKSFMKTPYLSCYYNEAKLGGSDAMAAGSGATDKDGTNGLRGLMSVLAENYWYDGCSYADNQSAVDAYKTGISAFEASERNYSCTVTNNYYGDAARISTTPVAESKTVVIYSTSASAKVPFLSEYTALANKRSAQQSGFGEGAAVTYDYWNIDYTALNSALTAAKTAYDNQDKYCETNFADFVSAYESAKALDQSDSSAPLHQEDVDALESTLTGAQANITLHNYVKSTLVAPTCVSEGTDKYTCSKCEDFYTEPTDPTGVHTPVTDDAVEPTCEGTGLTEGSHCAVCDEVLTAQQVREALGHSFKHYVSNEDATCTKDGTKTAKCERCSATDTQPDEGTALDHDYEITEVIAPTFTAQGYTVYTCARCEDTYNADFKPALKAVAEVNGEKFDTVAKALAAADEGDVVILLDEEAVIPEGYYATPVQEDGNIYILEQGNISAEEPNDSVNLTLDDTVDMNFRIDARYYTSDVDAYFKVDFNRNNTCENKHTDYMDVTSLPVDGDGRRVITIDSAPAQLTEEVTIGLYDSRDILLTQFNDYSMKQYCDDIIDSGSDASDLCYSLIDYAAAAQTFFNYNLDNMAAEQFHANFGAVTLDSVKDKFGAGISDGIGLGITGITLMAQSNTEVRFYCPLEEEEVAYYHISLEMTEKYGTGDVNAYFGEAPSGTFIGVRGIESANLDNNFRIEIVDTRTGKATVINYNALNYCISNLKNSKDTKLINLCKSIILYNEAAQNFFVG